MSCASVDIEVCQSADWSLVVQYADEDGLFVDITSATITARIWASLDGDLVTSPTVTKLDATRGKMELTMTPAQTALLGDNMHWELWLELGSATELLMQGRVYVTETRGLS